jgi:hypothetical protein
MLLREGVQTCYVGVDQNDTACYMQWLIGPKENMNFQRIFHGGFPWLKQDEALLEDAFTPESHWASCHVRWHRLQSEERTSTQATLLRLCVTKIFLHSKDANVQDLCRTN